MAPFGFRPLQQDLLSSITTPCKYPSSTGFKTHSSPHFLTLSTPSHALLHIFPHICTVRSHAGNLAEEMLHREQTHERKPKNWVGRSADGQMGGLNGGKERDTSKDRGFRDYGEMGLSGFSSWRSGDQGESGKTRKDQGDPMAGDKISRGQGRTEEKMVKKRTRKAKANRPGFEFRVGLDMCSKTGDVMGAIALYDSAVREGFELQQYHYNVLLYLCSSAAIGVIHPAKSGSSGGGGNSGIRNSDREDLSDTYSEEQLGDLGDYGTPIQVSSNVRDYARSRGFEIYEKMLSERVPMSEAALTSVARMAMSMGNGDMAFEIVKQIKSLNLTPRLRSYSPAIFAFCENGDIEKAFEVERHMIESGVYPEEAELEALLRASVGACRGEKVYYLLHKLRTRVRQVSPPTAQLIETWFKSPTASRVGKRKWNAEMVTQAMENGGGGWHGLGWLGKGKWTVVRTHVDADGICGCCGEKLVTIDLDPIETENLARSIASIASKRERRSSFQSFQKWLDYYGPFEAVVDAANVGLFSQRRFSLIKINAVVNGIRQKLPSKKWPLIIVHNKRLLGGKMDEPLGVKLIEKWKNADAIYATPTGSNDDWYWLYAAVKCKSLIVTNDEMRDHIFQILGNDFFPKWKERHQVHFSLHDGNFEFHMPPPCSVVIQESKEGHWHIPISAGHESERERTWLCVTRANSCTTQESAISSKEAHPKKLVRSSASDTQSCNQMRPLSCDGCEQERNPIAERPHKKLKSPQRDTASIESWKTDSIIDDIKGAEKLSGCVIDFQI